MRDTVGLLDPAHLPAVLAHLRLGYRVGSPNGAYRVSIPCDIFEPRRRIPTSGSGYYFSDGLWVWHEELPYYVEHYQVGLPEDSLQHILRTA